MACCGNTALEGEVFFNSNQVGRRRGLGNVGGCLAANCGNATLSSSSTSCSSLSSESSSCGEAATVSPYSTALATTNCKTGCKKGIKSNSKYTVGPKKCCVAKKNPLKRTPTVPRLISSRPDFNTVCFSTNFNDFVLSDGSDGCTGDNVWQFFQYNIPATGETYIANDGMIMQGEKEGLILSNMTYSLTYPPNNSTSPYGQLDNFKTCLVLNKVFKAPTDGSGLAMKIMVGTQCYGITNNATLTPNAQTKALAQYDERLANSYVFFQGAARSLNGSIGGVGAGNPRYFGAMLTNSIVSAHHGISTLYTGNVGGVGENNVSHYGATLPLTRRLGVNGVNEIHEIIVEYFLTTNTYNMWVDGVLAGDHISLGQVPLDPTTINFQTTGAQKTDISSDMSVNMNLGSIMDGYSNPIIRKVNSGSADTLKYTQNPLNKLLSEDLLIYQNPTTLAPIDPTEWVTNIGGLNNNLVSNRLFGQGSVMKILSMTVGHTNNVGSIEEEDSC